MKALKTISAVLLSVAVILSFAACHKKGETVMTVGETKIDSGLYLAFQYNAYNQFISDVGSDPSIHKRTDRRPLGCGSRPNLLHPFENEPRACEDMP